MITASRFGMQIRVKSPDGSKDIEDKFGHWLSARTVNYWLPAGLTNRSVYGMLRQASSSAHFRVSRNNLSSASGGRFWFRLDAVNGPVLTIPFAFGTRTKDGYCEHLINQREYMEMLPSA